MKKILLISLMLCCANVFAQKTQRPIVTSNNSSIAKVEYVEISELTTDVKISGRFDGSGRIALQKGTYLVVTDSYGVEYKYPFMFMKDETGESMELGQWYSKSGDWSVTISFMKIPAGYTSICVREPDLDGTEGWKFNDIRITNPAKSPISKKWLAKASAQDVAKAYYEAYVKEGDMEKALMCEGDFLSLSRSQQIDRIRNERSTWEENESLASLLTLSFIDEVTQRPDSRGKYDAIVEIPVSTLAGTVKFTMKMKKGKQGWSVEDMDVDMEKESDTGSSRNKRKN